MKKNLAAILLFTMFTSINTFAQPVITKQADIGGSGEDRLFQISNTKDGGIIMGGSSYSNVSFSKSENSRGQSDYWIVKLNKAGRIEWDKTYGGSSEDDFAAMEPTADGGYILGGTSFSNESFEKSENSKGLDDYWIVKVDSLGNKQWDKTLGGSNIDILQGLQQTADGGYILCGSSYSNISSDKSQNNLGFLDYWVVKVDAQGNKQWDKTYGGSNIDEAYAVLQTADGGYLIGGASGSNVSSTKSENSRGSEDYWIIKTDSLGNKQWDKAYGGAYIDDLRCLRQTNDGGYILGGYSDSQISGEKTENSYGLYDYWMVKIGSHGKVLWDKTIGGNSNDFFSSLIQTQDRGYILAGISSSGISGYKTEASRGDSDYWVVKTDNHGNVSWNKTIGGNRKDLAQSIIEKGKGNFVVGGYTYSGISGDKTQAKKGSRDSSDYWLVDVKYDSTAAKALVTNNLTATANNKDFKVYPIPAKDILHVESDNAFFTLTNESGKTVLSETVVGSATINLAHLPPGVYYLNNTNTNVTKKIIISR